MASSEATTDQIEEIGPPPELEPKFQLNVVGRRKLVRSLSNSFSGFSLRKKVHIFHKLDKIKKRAKPGDVIEFEMKKKVRDYHDSVVYVGDNKVVYRRDEEERQEIVQESLDVVATKRKARILNEVIAKRYSGYSALAGDEIVGRARSKVGTKNGWLNSEVFAVWCRLGDIKFLPDDAPEQGRASLTDQASFEIPTTPEIPISSFTSVDKPHTLVDYNDFPNNSEEKTRTEGVTELPAGDNNQLIKFKINPVKLQELHQDVLTAILNAIIHTFVPGSPGVTLHFWLDSSLADPMVAYKVSVGQTHCSYLMVPKVQLLLARVGITAVQMEGKGWQQFNRPTDEGVGSFGEGSLESPRIVTGVSAILNCQLVEEIKQLVGRNRTTEESLAKETQDKEELQKRVEVLEKELGDRGAVGTERLHAEIKEREERLEEMTREKTIIMGRRRVSEQGRDEAEAKLKRSELQLEKVEERNRELNAMVLALEEDKKQLEERMRLLETENQQRSRSSLTAPNSSQGGVDTTLKTDSANAEDSLRPVVSQQEHQLLIANPTEEGDKDACPSDEGPQLAVQVEELRREKRELEQRHQQQLSEHEKIFEQTLEEKRILSEELEKRESSGQHPTEENGVNGANVCGEILNRDSVELQQPSSAVPPLAEQSTPEQEGPIKEDTMNSVFGFVAKQLNSKNWKRFGRELGLKEGQLDTIEAENSGDLEEQKYQMLLKWQAVSKESEVNIQALVQTLSLAGLRNLADKVQKTFLLPNQGAEGDPDAFSQQQCQQQDQTESGCSFPTTGTPIENLPAKVLSKDMREALSEMNFTSVQLATVLKKLKINKENKSQLTQASQPPSVMNVLEVWENQTKPMEQDKEKRRKLVYTMVKTLRDAGVADAVGIIKNRKGPGFIGPKEALNLPISKMSFSQRLRLAQKLTIKNDNGGDWRHLAESLKIEAMHIQLWQQKDDPGEQLLLTWQTKSEATVGKLYNLLVDLGMADTAGVLEE